MRRIAVLIFGRLHGRGWLRSTKARPRESDRAGLGKGGRLLDWDHSLNGTATVTITYSFWKAHVRKLFQSRQTIASRES